MCAVTCANEVHIWNVWVQCVNLSPVLFNQANPSHEYSVEYFKAWVCCDNKETNSGDFSASDIVNEFKVWDTSNKCSGSKF